MSGFGEKQPDSAKAKKSDAQGLHHEKSAKNWFDIMSDEGGKMGSFTDDLFKKAESMTEKDWEDVCNTINRSETGRFEISDVHDDGHVYTPDDRSIDEIHFPELRAFETQFARTWAKGGQKASSAVPPNMTPTLLGAGILLQKVFHRFLPEQYDKLFDVSIDMDDPTLLTIDNVQTMIDVESLLTRFVHTPQELTPLMQRLLQVCPNDEVTVGERQIKINPLSYTYLELFALAPFSFWANSVRNQQPATYAGEPIVRPNDAERPIDPGFIYMVTRQVANVQRSDTLKRHGGCPVLHPEFRKLDLINRLGKLFIRAQNEFLKRDAQRETSAQ